MSRAVSKALIMGALLVAALTASATSAFAATWTSNGTSGGVAFTATAPAMKFQINSSPAVGIVCATASRRGVFYGPGPNALSVKVMDSYWVLSSCTVAGLPATANCSSSPPGMATFATGQTGNVVSLTIKQNGTSSAICTFTVAPLPGCVITLQSTSGAGGAIATGTYDVSTGATTMSSSGQTVSFDWTAACTIFATRPGSASGQVGANTTPLSDIVDTITSIVKFIITVWP